MTETIENTPAAWSERARQPAEHQAVLWSEAGQRERFKAVLAHLELRAGDTVLDFGCGTGAFSRWLPPTVRYFAHDWADGMLDRVRADHAKAIVLQALETGDEFDHVVAVGPFNLDDGWSRERTWATVADLWARARRTLVVALYRGRDLRCIRYTPEEACAHATDLDCARFAVDATYLDNDFSLVLRT